MEVRPRRCTRRALCSPDPSHAWFASAASARSEQYLFTSGDSGARWQDHPLPALDENEVLDAVHFADGDLGVLTGGPGLCQLQPPVAFVTEDAGEAWQRRDLPATATGVRFTLIATSPGRALTVATVAPATP